MPPPPLRLDGPERTADFVALAMQLASSGAGPLKGDTDAGEQIRNLMTRDCRRCYAIFLAIPRNIRDVYLGRDRSTGFPPDD